MSKAEKLRILLLLVGTVAAVWGVFMPSVTTLGKFGLGEATEQERADLYRGAIGFSVVSGLLIWGAWKVCR